MEETATLVKTSMEEIRGLLSAETVVGEPIIVGGNTIIPLVSVGFGFGGGGGTGKGGRSEKDTGEGKGGGTGGGGGIKPVALIIVNEEGVRVEAIKGGVVPGGERFRPSGQGDGEAGSRKGQRE